MNVWVDADALPGAIRDILVRAAERTGIRLTLVANHAIALPRRPNLRMLQVPQGADVADNEIVRRLEPEDLVITQDLPLADEVLKAGGHVLTPRGEALTAENIGARLNMRDFLETMRASGSHSGGPAPMDRNDRSRFANALDRWLARRAK